MADDAPKFHFGRGRRVAVDVEKFVGHFLSVLSKICLCRYAGKR
jgi:hypothetical protein